MIRRRVVADDPVVAEPDHGLALGGDEGEPDLLVLEPLLDGGVEVSSILGCDVGRLVIELGPETVDELEMIRVFGGQTFEPLTRRIGGGLSGDPCLDLQAGPGHDTQPADDPGQGEALPDQGRQDDAQRQVDEQCSFRDGGRQRESRGERNHPAHARPGDDEHRAGRRIRVARP